MYAVIETGGKQYRVEVGTEFEVELLEAEAGESITLERVLLVADGADAAVGTPLVADAAVDAEVVGRERGDKVIAFKYRPKARRRVKKGHRQQLTLLRIADIRYQGRSAAEGAAKAPSKAAERKRVEEAAARQAAEDAALAAKLNLAQPAEEAAEAEPKPAKRSRAKATASEPPAKTETPAAEPKAPARRRTARAKTTTDEGAKTTTDEGATATEATDGGEVTDTPKAAPRRKRTKKDE